MNVFTNKPEEKPEETEEKTEKEETMEVEKQVRSEENAQKTFEKNLQSVLNQKWYQTYVFIWVGAVTSFLISTYLMKDIYAKLTVFS